MALSSFPSLTHTLRLLHFADSQSDLRHFLKTIHDDFLRVVNPRECGLLDIMMQADLLTDTDYESLSGKDVYIRKDQVR